MLRRILVAQLLTVFLDPVGASPTELMEAFPEEFRSEQDASERPPRSSFPSRAANVAWSVASEDLTDALVYLVDLHLVTIEPDGRVVPAAVAHTADVARSTSLADESGAWERTFDAVARDDAFATEPARTRTAEPRFDELGELFGFDAPRLDV